MKLKTALCIAYILVVTAMAAATIVEKYGGSAAAHTAVYGSWWFVALWGVTAVVGALFFLRRHQRKAGVTGLHASLLIVLVGALLTRLTAVQGIVHLRIGEPTDIYIVRSGSDIKSARLPFTIELLSFDITYREGTSTAADYRSRFTLTDREGSREGSVSMNNIYSHDGYRLYQMSYDDDMRGSTLSVNSDRWGIAVTYCGYGLLLLSLLWLMADPEGPFRRLLRSDALRRGALLVAVIMTTAAHANANDDDAPPTVPQWLADEICGIHVEMNGRICPLETYAILFTTKLTGRRTYKGLTASQVMCGWMFFGEEWANEPFIRVKRGAMKSQLALPDRCPLTMFFNDDYGGYRLGPYIREYGEGNRDAFHRQAADIDAKLQLLFELRRGAMLRVFPYTFQHDVRRTHTERAVTAGSVLWYSPLDALPADIDADKALFIHKVWALVYEVAREGDYNRVSEIIGKIAVYQRDNGGASLPSPEQVWAEHAYNAFPYSTALFIANLTIGVVALVYMLRLLTRHRRLPLIDKALPVLLCVSFLTLSFLLALRWIASATIPLSNGYETMLVVAWWVMLFSLLLCRRIHIVIMFGFLLSGFFLLVSHINQMDPAIGTLMPVLDSPLLSIHVSIVMMSYALLALTFLCAIMGLLLPAHQTPLCLLSRLLLFPAVASLAVGIFVGALWANISWGTYWSWDAKETWALITLMVYAVPLHAESIPILRQARAYHLFMLIAFLTVLITYFGVNYFLGGMHSYA